MAWLDTVIAVFRGLSAMAYLTVGAALFIIVTFLLPPGEERRARQLGLRLGRLTPGRTPFGFPYCFYWYKGPKRFHPWYYLYLGFRFDGTIDRFPFPAGMRERGWRVAALRRGLVVLRFDDFRPWSTGTVEHDAPRTQADLAALVDAIDPVLKERVREPAEPITWKMGDFLQDHLNPLPADQ
jgi:hypothetical protein